MKAYAFTAPAQPLAEMEWPTPAPAGAQVLVRTRFCGVCHSDLHLQDGKFDLGEGQDFALPFERGVVFGHEVYGEVEAVGPDVRDVKPGDRVIVYSFIGCGECDLCRGGLEHVCQSGQMIGSGKNPGGFGDHVLVPHERYCVDASGIEPSQAGPLACSGITSYGAIKRVPNLGPASRVVVIGAGGLGIMGIGILKGVFGVSPIVVDIDDAKLAAARAAGAGHVVNGGAPDALMKIMELTGGGADAAIDFVGSEHTAPLAFHAVRVGGKAILVGLYGGTLKIPSALVAMLLKTIEGSNVAPLADFRELVGLARAGKVPPIPVTVRPACEVNAVLDDLRHGRVVGRAVLEHAST